MNDEIVLINESVKNKIIDIRNTKVLLDSDVAELYAVETRRINEAVRNNPDKFPEEYLFELTAAEWVPLKSKFSTSIKGGKTKLPTAFSEKGLYMLATILKSPRATATTIAIIEAFAKTREIKRTIVDAVKHAETGKDPKKIINVVGKLVSDLIIPDHDDLATISIEDEAEFKFMGILKLSRKIIKQGKKPQK